MAILFCNIGWMEYYQGLRNGDNILKGGKYPVKTGKGHEVCNFAKYKNECYGAFQAPGVEIDIQRIGAIPGDEQIEGVTVVWTASRPQGGTVIVGWYKNATVFRKYSVFI